MAVRPLFHVRTRTLLAIAGCVWFAAGFNVARLGILSYRELRAPLALPVLLSAVVFLAFGLLFLRMSARHSRRIASYREETRPFWNFFDLRSYAIMAFMMGGGIWLRASGLVPGGFIAVFYTGLGCALALAGLSFWRFFILFGKKADAAGKRPPRR